ncbi:NADH-quinone oxidoreductase subunit NuoF [Halarsenatibacter silvermanii]|uniref:NAD(P)-dependent iron-only hydrogenase diaphorase component flavoprotein n=1 Tax=Halarsenatibacter silvermanii TaxID=321763 RepID=A0A1G9L1E9_9FIRM|nr:NADH-quinone oxidoreductase subunit NuoF [Halarsenatibacter silvermanii]SDL55808.1 NAD(P)-dependent iron-only hydrogenase diaphorase component flavoprotein [Halarsenatibacter silvermanii]
MSIIESAADLEEFQNRAEKEYESHDKLISMCGGTGCRGGGCQDVIEELQTQLEDKGITDEVGLKVTGCQGFCEMGPLMVIRPEGNFYCNIEPEDVEEILEKTIKKGEAIERLEYVEPQTQEKIIKEQDIPFYKNQGRIVFESNGHISPTDIEDYFAVDGYTGLKKALLEMEQEDVIDEVKESGLRGRGGGGFPTGKKWDLCYQQDSEPKYLICNSDEGDPGAYMDRSIKEGNPHLVLEGMIIAAYAIGASQGFIYIRAEYPLAVEHITEAVKQAREYGLLGEEILGTDFSFDIEIMEGAGAFVCGEETALMASIEGERGMPRPRPPYPAESGLWGQPTNINNVESYANVPLIIRDGADWFNSVGTENSTGTKIFSLVGKVNNTGLIEVPMGISLEEVVFDIGGGIPGDKKAKAVQTGGPSGGCIPRDMFDIPVDFDKLQEVGSIMGSGGLVVMDEDTCMVDVAKFFLDFTQDESCGKCPPCRLGTRRMLEILERITSGEGRKGDIELLEELGERIIDTSLCGLGQTAPNPVLSTIEYFRDEYEAHIYEKSCPAGVCQNLIFYHIIDEECQACDRCRQICPVDAIEGEPGEDPYRIFDDACIRCGNCLDECPFDAIEIVPGQREEVGV